MAVTQLILYNGALGKLGETKLSSTSEAREPRYALDAIYTDRDARRTLLEMGYWKFAIRTVQIAADEDTTPEFGDPFAFTKPDDWVRTYNVSASEFLEPPLESFIEEAGFWFANVDPIYVRYVSNDADYGLSFSKWPYLFVEALEWFLAKDVARAISKPKDAIDDIDEQFTRALAKALQFEAHREPPKRMPTGTLVNSRFGRNYRYDPRITR